MNSGRSAYCHGSQQSFSQFREETAMMPRRIHQRAVIATTLLAILMLSTPMSVRALDVGDKAPDFLAFGTVDESVRLSDYQGKKNVMMFFFVRAFGGV
jgi:hypothetical protein